MAIRFQDVVRLIDEIMWKNFYRRLAKFLLNEDNVEDANIVKIPHKEIGIIWVIPAGF